MGWSRLTPAVFCGGIKNGAPVGKARVGQEFFGFQAVKFNPGIFPGDFPVRNISAYLVWEHHKTLAAFYLVGDGLPSGIFCN